MAIREGGQFTVGGNGRSPVEEAAEYATSQGGDSAYFWRVYAVRLERVALGLLVAAVVTSVVALARG